MNKCNLDWYTFDLDYVWSPIFVNNESKFVLHVNYSIKVDQHSFAGVCASLEKPRRHFFRLQLYCVCLNCRREATHDFFIFANSDSSLFYHHKKLQTVHNIIVDLKCDLTTVYCLFFEFISIFNVKGRAFTFFLQI